MSNCPHGDESFVVADYLAGRLSAADASAFEEHAFACDRCFEELERATEVRSAAGGAAPRRPSRALPWPALALAAALVLAAGLWIARPLVDSRAVYRAGEDAGSSALRLEVTRAGERIALSWQPVSGAELYEVRVFTAAGHPVHSQRSESTSVQLFPAEWPDEEAPGGLHVQVIAFDELRQPVARSRLAALQDVR